jgi:hypothetical protein
LFARHSEAHWYSALLRQVAPQKTAVYDNQLTIVTFNYDRSLEHFLFEAFRERFGASDEEAASFVTHLKILHVHGRLGSLPWQESGGFPYGDGNSLARVREAAAGIRIIHEADGKTEPFNLAREALRQARYVFFLGFGFHRLNVERLGLPFEKIPRFNGDEKWHLSGTCYGFTSTEHSILRERLGGQVDFPGLGLQIHEFMRHVHYLYAAEGRA